MQMSTFWDSIWKSAVQTIIQILRMRNIAHFKRTFSPKISNYIFKYQINPGNNVFSLECDPWFHLLVILLTKRFNQLKFRNELICQRPILLIHTMLLEWVVTQILLKTIHSTEGHNFALKIEWLFPNKTSGFHEFWLKCQDSEIRGRIETILLFYCSETTY